MSKKKFLSTKDKEANEFVATMLNLIKLSLFGTKDSYFKCNLG